MKKFISLLMVSVMTAALFCGCGKSTPSTNQGDNSTAGAFSGTMSELVDEIYKNHQDIGLSFITAEISLADKDDLSFNAGLASADDVTDIVRSESAMGSQAYSLVLARTKGGAAEKVAVDMFNNIDTRKWVCVEADQKIAAYSGDIAMFFMVTSEYNDTVTTDSMLKAFETAIGGNAFVIK